VVDIGSHLAVGPEAFGMKPGTPIAQMVERMAGLGLPENQIALILGISDSEVRTRYSAAVKLGQAKANLKVANVAFAVACDRTHPKFATMSIFWQRSRMGLGGALGASASDEADEIGEAKAAVYGESAAGYRKAPKPRLDQPEVTARFDALMKSFSPAKKNAAS